MKKYEYMVVYSVRGGVGRIRITSEKLIQSYDDVENLDNIIRKHNGLSTAFATNFKLLREYEE